MRGDLSNAQSAKCARSSFSESMRLGGCSANASRHTWGRGRKASGHSDQFNGALSVVNAEAGCCGVAQLRGRTRLLRRVDTPAQQAPYEHLPVPAVIWLRPGAANLQRGMCMVSLHLATSDHRLRSVAVHVAQYEVWRLAELWMPAADCRPQQAKP